MIGRLEEQLRSKERDATNILGRLADSRAGALLLCLTFSLVMVYHFVIPLNAILSTNGTVWNDPAHSIWSLWLVNENVTSGRSLYATNMVFYPVGAPLIHPTVIEGFFPVTFLVKKLSRGDVMYPVYAYRIIVLLCFTLILYFTYLLLRALDFTRWAAATGSVGFAFCDFFIEHAPHVSLLAGFFIPLAALSLLRLYRRPASGPAVVAGLMVALAIYFTELALYVFLGLLFILLAMCLLRRERKALLEKLRLLGWKRILLASGVCLAVMMPFLINHFLSGVRKPLFIESSNFSSNLAGFIIPAPQRTPLYGNLFSTLSARITAAIDGRETFIGFPLLVFALIALLTTREKMVRVSAAVSMLFFVLSLGPTLKVFGTETGLPMPYALLMKIPPFDLSRTPVRFVVMGIFFLTIVAASGIAWTQHALRSRLGLRLSFVVLLIVFVWTVAEAYAPLPRQPSFVPPAELANLLNGPVLNLPASRFDGYALLLQVFHKQPIATGYISRFSELELKHVENLTRLEGRGGLEFCDELKRLGIRNVIINPVPVVDAPFELSGCQVNVVDLRRQDNDYALYEIGTRIDFSRPDAGKYLGYGWSVPETFSRWTDRGMALIAFRFEHTGPVVLRLKLAPFLVTGKLDQQQLRVKLNKQPVGQLTLRETDSKEYSIALPANLLRDQNIVTFELPDAESPKNLGVSEDTRLLGVNVQWLLIDTGSRQDVQQVSRVIHQQSGESRPKQKPARQQGLGFEPSLTVGLLLRSPWLRELNGAIQLTDLHSEDILNRSLSL